MSFPRSTQLLCLSFQTLMSIIRNGLPILVELIDLVNSVITFPSQMTLVGSLTMILTALLFWIYLFLLTLVFVLQWLSLHWRILIMLLSQFPLTFHHIHKGMSRFIALLMTIIVLIGTVFCDHLRGVPWEDIFKLSASPAANEFYQWVQVGIDVYIPHRMSQVKPHSSPWFPAACTAAIVQKSLFSFVPKG